MNEGIYKFKFPHFKHFLMNCKKAIFTKEFIEKWFFTDWYYTCIFQSIRELTYANTIAENLTNKATKQIYIKLLYF